MRALYDGRNGRAYTAVAKLIVQEGHLPLEGLTLARWTGWLRDHPDEAKRLIRRNASYIFFRLAEVEEPTLGPRPGRGERAALPRHRPRRRWHAVALRPAVLAGGPPAGRAGGRARTPDHRRRHRLGHRRAGAGDLFVGSGAQAGIAAGNLRDPVGFVVLLPRHGGGS